MANVNMTKAYADRLNDSVKFTEGFNNSTKFRTDDEIRNRTQFAKITEVIPIGEGAPASVYTEYKAIEVFFNQTTGDYSSVPGMSYTWDSDSTDPDLTLFYDNLISTSDSLTSVGTIVSVDFVEATVASVDLIDDGRHCFTPGGRSSIGFADIGSGSGQNYTGTIRTLPGGLGDIIESGATITAANLQYGGLGSGNDDLLANYLNGVWYIQPSTF